MKKALQKMLGSVKGALDITTVVIEVVLVTALIPVIIVFINGVLPNLTAVEQTLLSLVTLFIILALVFGIAKRAGLIKKK